MIDYKLIDKKINIAVEEMNRKDIDVWLTYAEESENAGDPMVRDLIGLDVVGETALLITREGERKAILAGYDVDGPKESGLWDVIGYSEDIKPILKETVSELKPKRIAVNTSKKFNIASGLRHAHHAMLSETLSDYAPDFTCSEDLIVAMRGKRLPEELERIKVAVQLTEEIFEEITQELRPGISEIELANFIRQRITGRNKGFAWGEEMCPIVTFGKNTGGASHRPGSEKRLEKGELVIVDVGVEHEGYVSDMQRTWYVLGNGESEAPEKYRRAFDVNLKSMQAALDNLREGVLGNDIDNISKKVISDAGYTPMPFCTGHPIGRTAHEIGALLGPDKIRYKKMAFIELKAGQVYAVEPAVKVDGQYGIGLEEDVLITKNGCEVLSHPQTEFIYI